MAEKFPEYAAFKVAKGAIAESIREHVYNREVALSRDEINV